MKNSRFYVYTFILLFIFACESKKNVPLSYPITNTIDSVDTYFGTEVPDPYRWLEDDLSPETAAWVEAENKVSFSYLEKIPYRDKIKERLEILFDYERVYKPERHGAYDYFFKNDGLQNQNVLYRKKEEETEVFLDPNKFSKEGTISLMTTQFTDDGSLCGYLISEGGSDWRKAVVMDTETKEIIGDTLHHIKFSGLSWLGKEGFFYSSYDTPKEGSALSAKTQYHKLYYHRLGTKQHEDELIFGGEKNPYRYIYGYVTEDHRYLVITAAKSTSGNVTFVKDLDDEAGSIITVDDNIATDEFVLHSIGDKLFIQTNDQAPNGKVVETTIPNPTIAHWKDVISETEHVLSTSTGGGYLFANYLIDARTAIKQFTFEGAHIRDVELPAIGTVYGFSCRDDENFLYYTFTSFTYPRTVLKYDISSGKSVLYAQPEVNFNPENYVIKQEFYKSKDGTKVPMFIVHKKDLELNGKNPTYLYGYGGFNVSLKPTFSTSRILWLENGGIYAQPNIRGGGEYGEKWHKGGTKLKKQNVFDDFIAAAEWLEDHQYTSSEYLAIAGGSNGGLLVGAVMTQRPELAKVALPAVGVLDMLRYHKFTAGAGWASDYGTSEESEEMFQYLKEYSPIHNIKSGVAYSATLITTADHDDRVVPAHSFKFAATLQKNQEGGNPVLIRIETNAGHGAGKPISKIIEEIADKYSFAWYNMDYIPELAKKEM